MLRGGMTTPAKCREYYAKNREMILAQKRTEYAALSGADRRARLDKHKPLAAAWYRKNKEHVARLQVERIAANPQAHRDMQTRWRKGNPEKDRGRYRRRRALRRMAEGRHTAEQWLLRITFYGWRCFYCRVGLTAKTVTQDHVKPVSHGGSEWPANLVPACSKCNRKKWDRPWREALAWLCRAA